MPMVHRCEYEGCDVLTMGEFCVEHEQETNGDLTHALTAAAGAAAAESGSESDSS
jgi:hypothetical protein